MAGCLVCAAADGMQFGAVWQASAFATLALKAGCCLLPSLWQNLKSLSCSLTLAASFRDTSSKVRYQTPGN